MFDLLCQRTILHFLPDRHPADHQHPTFISHAGVRESSSHVLDTMETSGFEPLASCLQGRRSPT